MSQCKIYLENYSGIYYAGSEIRGRIECYFDDRVTVRGIKVRIKCKEHNSWTGTESYTDPVDHKSKTRHITLTGDNTVMFIEQMLFGSGSSSTEIGPGRHVYPFSCILPHDIPSSFKGPHGAIAYKVKAVVDRPMRTDYEDEFIFIVQSPIDFNHMLRDLQDISTYSDEKSVCCWCCKGGNLTMDVELPKIAFVPGETIPFKVRICNLSNSNVESLKVKFTKTITYKVTSPHSESKDDVEQIVTFNEHGVGAHGEFTYNLQLAIPAYVEVPNFTKCNLFKVNYDLKVTAEMPTCTMDLDITAWDIKMGHVQYINYPHGNAGGKVPVPQGSEFTPVQPNINYPPPTGGPYPPPTAEPYPPPPGGQYPGGFVPPPSNMPYPPPQYSSGNTSSGGPPAFGYPVYPPAPDKQPSAPSSSIASAPADDNPKSREAANNTPTVPNPVPDFPPPSYNQVHQSANLPYPPQ